MPTSPGTVSRILWHFTGGPEWDKETNKQKTESKPVADAYAALVGILGSRELRIGGYKDPPFAYQMYSSTVSRS